ncbi:MAG TPA: toll/interleukin-1 receptor domain-containing protein [Pyrinomonadaceae bacterium]|nr:toll/interleukin-1 receptor domain-containing protein [Pyrinomonadaceae bacterium]
MAAYISHSEIDDAMVTALRGGLKAQNIDTWDPTSMGTGLSRSAQVREAIGNCDVCIFMVTQSSLKDPWCMAEVGAFWGAGKRVIVFMLDPKADESLIPPQLKGDLPTTKFEKVVEDVRKIILEADERRRMEEARRPRKVSEMTIEMLYDALASLRSTALDSLPMGEAMRLIQEHISHDLAEVEVMQPLINRLVGVPQVFIEGAASRYWPKSFTLTTNTGEWQGFASRFTSYQLIDEYSNCLLIFYKDKSCAAAAAANSVVVQEGKVRCDGLIVNPGLIDVGETIQLLAKGDA